MTLSRLDATLLRCSRGPYFNTDDGGSSKGGDDPGTGDDAQSGGEQDDATSGDEGKDGKGDDGAGKDDGGFKPITSEAELAKWKDGVRKSITADLRKSIAADLQRQAQEDANKAAGKWEQVAEARQTEIDRLKGEVERLEGQIAEGNRAELRRAAAKKHGIPDNLADRLKGETEAELDADAKAVAKSLGKRQAPDTEGGAGEGTSKSGASDRPVKRDGKGEGDQPSFTFDGRKKVAWKRQ